jgi:hypothetical protein
MEQASNAPKALQLLRPTQRNNTCRPPHGRLFALKNCGLHALSAHRIAQQLRHY